MTAPHFTGVTYMPGGKIVVEHRNFSLICAENDKFGQENVIFYKMWVLALLPTEKKVFKASLVCSNKNKNKNENAAGQNHEVTD